MKKVISLRLSDEKLRELDQACERLSMNRTEAISQAISLLQIMGKEKDKLIVRTPWLLEPLTGDSCE